MSLKTTSSRVLSSLLNTANTTRIVASCQPGRVRHAAAEAAVRGRSSTRGYYNTAKPRCPRPAEASHVRLVDLRSDTVTKPGLTMRRAMMEAEVGDDVMGEDPTVNVLKLWYVYHQWYVSFLWWYLRNTALPYYTPGKVDAAVRGRISIRSLHKAIKSSGQLRPHARVVDLRTDVVAKPGTAMCQAMMEAWNKDFMVKGDPGSRLSIASEAEFNELQQIAADMFGMEAALLLPTGTMSNLIAAMVHCPERGDEMIVGDLSHMHIYEQGGSSQLAGVHTTTVTTLPDGTFDLEQLESRIRNYHGLSFCRSRLICLENTHNIRGGCVLPLTFLQEVRDLADRYGLSVHMDGARLMNAAVAQGVTPSTILQYTDTVSVCLSKGLGAPLGAILAGPKDFIARAMRCQRALGGTIWKTRMMQAAGKVALLDNVRRMELDHLNAKTFGQALVDCYPQVFSVEPVETNLVRFSLKERGWSPSEFCALMGEVGEGEEAALGQGIKVLMISHFGNAVRATWHLDISPEDTQLAVQKMQFVVSQRLKGKSMSSCEV